MTRKYKYNLVRSRRSYIPAEIARLLGVSARTVFRWIKKDGLQVMEKNKNPLLIMGDELKRFIKKMNKKKKVKLKSDEMYCLKCRKPVKGINETITIRETGKVIGKEKRKQECKSGICEICGSKIYRLL